MEDLGPILPDGWFEAHGHTPVEPDEDAGGDAEVGEEGEANADQPGGRGSQDGAHRGADGVGGEGQGASAARRATATVPFEKFQQVRDMLVGHIRRKELEDETLSEGAGMKQADLTAWYIKEVADTQGIADTKDLLAELKLARAIIGHLIKRDGTLVVVQEAEPAPELPDAPGRSSTKPRRPSRRGRPKRKSARRTTGSSPSTRTTRSRREFSMGRAHAGVDNG